MNLFVSAISFVGTMASLGSAIFLFRSTLKTKKMQKINHGLEIYVKNKDFLLMKNAGEDPCDTKNKFTMPVFLQESNYVIRRNE